MDQLSWARQRIAAQRGRLGGWRAVRNGAVSVVAVQVLGMAREQPQQIGLQLMVAGRTLADLEQAGAAEAERMLRARAILASGDPFSVVRYGQVQVGDSASEDPLRWPCVSMIVHAPQRQLPAIAGLVSDEVPVPE